MAIKAVIFDCFGVLVTGSKAVLNDEFPELSQDIHDIFIRADYGYITFDEQYSLLAELTGKSVESLTAEHGLQSARNSSAFTWVRTLRHEGTFSVGLLSNIRRGGLHDFISETESAELFDAVVLSGDVGIIKPDIHIYELMAERLGVRVHECVMIDDMLVNIEGAERAGMHGVVYGNTISAQAHLQRIVEQQSRA